MRILLVFFIGFLSFFYLSEILRRTVTGIRYSFIGIIFAAAGLTLGFWGQPILAGGMNVLASFFFIGAGAGIIIHHLLTQRFVFFEKTEQAFVLKHENGFERFLEILPGSLTWLALTSPLWLSFTLPYAVAYLILIADVYWLLTALRIAVLILVGYRKMEWAKSQDWQKNGLIWLLRFAGSVQRLVRQRISLGVFLAGDVGDGEFLQAADQFNDLQVKRAQAGVPDPVLPINLFNQQLGIGVRPDLPRPQADRLFQRGNDCAVFRLVIRGGT